MAIGGVAKEYIAACNALLSGCQPADSRPLMALAAWSAVVAPVTMPFACRAAQRAVATCTFTRLYTLVEGDTSAAHGCNRLASVK